MGRVRLRLHSIESGLSAATLSGGFIPPSGNATCRIPDLFLLYPWPQSDKSRRAAARGSRSDLCRPKSHPRHILLMFPSSSPRPEKVHAVIRARSGKIGHSSTGSWGTFCESLLWQAGRRVSPRLIRTSRLCVKTISSLAKQSASVIPNRQGVAVAAALTRLNQDAVASAFRATRWCWR